MKGWKDKFASEKRFYLVFCLIRAWSPAKICDFQGKRPPDMSCDRFHISRDLKDTITALKCRG